MLIGNRLGTSPTHSTIRALSPSSIPVMGASELRPHGIEHLVWDLIHGFLLVRQSYRPGVKSEQQQHPQLEWYPQLLIVFQPTHQCAQY